MGILNITTDVAGQIGVKPRRVSIVTTDSLDTVTTAGYLNNTNLMGYTIQPTDEIVMFYDYVDSSSPGTMGIFNAIMSGSSITLVEWVNPGDVVTPTVANNVAIFNNTEGQLYDSGVHFSSLLNSVAPTLQGSQANYIPVFLTGGSLDKSSTTGGSLTYATFGQTSVLTLPDPGQSTANVLLDQGTNNILTDYQQFYGLDNIIGQTNGTWAVTRNIAGDWSLNKVAAADTSVTGFDLTVALRTASSKGFELRSIDVIYAIGTLALNAHTATLTKATYANNSAITLTNVPLTGTLATATQTNLYVTNLAVTTPAFLNTGISKYVFELTVNAAATTGYALYGINLHFYQTIA